MGVIVCPRHSKLMTKRWDDLVGIHKLEELKDYPHGATLIDALKKNKLLPTATVYDFRFLFRYVS